ncbi:MAG: UbiA family prenyltransferase [Chitinophagales bacterium]|nr:UbiA family prenyltransferase [Chitinophagales bacterium]MDW8428193.1 UbiA family prenyltransferase [Chitinophagales bacterium]
MNERSWLAKLVLDQLLRLGQAVLYGSLFIALCAASLVMVTCRQLTIEPTCGIPAVFVFFATLGVYNIHHLMGMNRAAATPQAFWVKNHRFGVLLLSIIGVGGAGFFFFQLRLPAQLLAVALAFIVVSYELKAFRDFLTHAFGGRLVLLKTFVIAAVWTAATVLIPAWNAQHPADNMHLALMLLNRFAFISLLALCFDARDQISDSRRGLLTIPVRFGMDFTLYLYRALTAASFVLIVVMYVLLWPSAAMAIALTLSVLAAYFAVSRADQVSSPYYYPMLVDGQMLLQWMLVMLLT